MNELYEWLDLEITSARRKADGFVTDTTALELYNRADALADVREHMRMIDPSLPVTPADNE